MGIFDRFTGTARPDKNAPRRSPHEVYRALMGINRDDAPFVVRDGTSEGVDLVAEWRVLEPAWYEHFRTFSAREYYSILLRLNPEKAEVRTTDQVRKVDWARGFPQLVHGAEATRGQDKSVESSWTIERDENGKLGLQRQATFSTEEMKVPMRDTVLAHGWTWRGVVFGSL